MRSSLITAGLLAFAFLEAPAASAPANISAPWIGTWAVNLEKSVFGPEPPNFKRATCVIETREDGLKVSYDIIGLRGGITHTEWVGKLDARDYAVGGVDLLLTNAYSPIDDHSFSVLTKVEGRTEATARTTVSVDGLTMTTVTTRRNARGESLSTTTVYEKRK